MDSKFLPLNQISYTLPFLLPNQGSFGGFVFVFAFVLKVLLWVRQFLFQQIGTFPFFLSFWSSFFKFLYFFEAKVCIQELTFNELLVF